ncbi:MAG: hypothetical protein CMD16_01475 [Flavobacteriales bacterium]|nr:hypothetical protein [Flavobacteriales bacterium]|tara:strand:+ start:10382 stop:10996 length:615 start_codon:yes stop_codon:yes gene_type:complete
MKKMYPLLAIFVVAAVLSSCTSTNKAAAGAPIDLPGDISHQTLEADITVDDTKKIKGSSSSTWFLMFRIEGDSEYADGVDYGAYGNVSAKSSPISWLWNAINPFSILSNVLTGDAAGKVKSSAAYDALNGTDADFIAHPRYVYTERNWFIIKQYEATVEGYPGYYSNIRSYDPVQRKLDQNLENAVNKKIIKKLGIGAGHVHEH